MKQKIVLGGILLAVVVLVLAGVYYNTYGLVVDVLEVQPGTIANQFEEEGKIVPQVEFSINAPFSGEILELPVQEGQTVQRGELLAIMDATELDYQLRQLTAQLKALQGEEAQAYQDPPEAQISSQELLVEQSRLEFAAAEKELERIQQLYEEGAATAQKLEEAEKRLNSARINLQRQLEALRLLEETGSPTPESRQYYAGRKEALQAQIDLLEHQLGKSRIAAPIEGVVAQLTVRPGDLVSFGEQLMTVFQKDSYHVEAYVLAESLDGIHEGLKVQLSQKRQGEDVVFSGNVTKIAPTAVEQISALGLEEQRVKITIAPNLPPDVQLLPGTSLDVEFVTNEQEGVLVVPKTALFPYGKGEALWLVDRGKAKIQPVETGLENNSHVVITQGLEPGDLVILNPQPEGLKEGKKVSVTNKEA